VPEFLLSVLDISFVGKQLARWERYIIKIRGECACKGQHDAFVFVALHSLVILAISVRNPSDCGFFAARFVRLDELDHSAFPLPYHDHVKVIHKHFRIARWERAACYKELCVGVQVSGERDAILSHRHHAVNPNDVGLSARCLCKRDIALHESAIQNFDLVACSLQTCSNVTDP
jgi:hypothetical protein